MHLASEAKSFVDLMQSVLNAHPGMPAGFFDPAGRVLLPLDSIDLTSLHRKRIQNYLRDFQWAASYIAVSVAVFWVMVKLQLQ